MVNKVILIGRLGKSPELKELASGTKYCRFSIATSESYKDKEGNWQEQTEWHNIILWRESAESAARRLKKGMLVYIEGKLTHRTWEDSDGKVCNITEVVAILYRCLEKTERAPEPNEPGVNTSSNSEPFDDGGDGGGNDDLPF